MSGQTTITVKQYQAMKNKFAKQNRFSKIERKWIIVFNGQEDYKLYARSGYEISVANYLALMARNKYVHYWKHENLELRFDGVKRGCLLWIPDFTTYDEQDRIINIYEVKGKFEPKDSTKIKRIKKFHPGLFEKLIYITDKRNFPKLAKLGVPVIDIREIKKKLG